MPPATIRNATNILMELRKICQHPYLSAPEIEDLTLSDERQQKELVQSSGKLAFLKILLPKLKAKGHRVLLFSQFKIALDRLQDFLYGEGYSFLRLDGDAPQAQRQKDMDAFNAPGSEIFVFLLTTRAGGVGINLASADTVIVYDPDFNPHQDLQAIARSHRFGQNKKVLVFKLMTKDSVEEQIIQNGKRKMVLDHLVVQNLGKDTGDEAEIDTMLLHGAKALYETNADGTSSTDVTYSSKQVDEMIEKVEKEADEEAKLLQAKWDKEDNMTEEEKREAMANRTTETMDFSFAKIWETERGDLAEVEDETEELGNDRVQADLEDELRLVQENAIKARERRKAEELERDRKDRRKKVFYAVEQDVSPKKKKAGRKSKGKDKLSGGVVQSSDSEFQVNTQDASGEDEEEEDDMDMDELPERIRDLLQNDEQAALFAGLGKRKSEISKLERKAMMKRFAEMAAQSTRAHGLIVEGPYTQDGIPPSLFLEPTPKRSKHPGETPEQRAARKAEKKQRKKLAKVLEMEGQMKGATEARGQSPKKASEPGPPPSATVSTGPMAPVAGPALPITGPSRVPSPTKGPPLVDAARQAMINREIAHGQATIDRLWHELERFGRQDQHRQWAIMALPHKSFAERMGFYWTLANLVDFYRRGVGEPAYFTDPTIRPQLELLFSHGAPGVAAARRPPQQQQLTGHQIAAPAVPSTNGRTQERLPTPTSGTFRPPPPTPTQLVATPPTNVTRPDLRPQPTPKRAVHLKSSIRPANIAIPAATPPLSANLAPPRPVSVAPLRPMLPHPNAPVPANSSRISPPNTSVASNPPRDSRSASGSMPPPPTGYLHQPYWVQQPPHFNGHGQAPMYGQAGSSRQSPITPTTVHPPPPVPPSNGASTIVHPPPIPRPNGASTILHPPPSLPTNGRDGICEFCLKSGHDTRVCPNRYTVPHLLRFRSQVVATLNKKDISPNTRKQSMDNLQEVDRRIQLHKRLEREDHQLSAVGAGATASPRQSAPTANHTRTDVSAGQQLRRLLLAPTQHVITGPEGRSKDTAIAIDDDDEMAVEAATLPQASPPDIASFVSANGATAPANGAGHATSSNGDGPPKTCQLCRHPGQHPLHQCPVFLSQSKAFQEEVAKRLPDDHPQKAGIHAALEALACPMCGQTACDLNLRECVERHGGRPALKNLIRKLDAEREESGLDATPALRKLYDCYKTWPREEDGNVRKKVKREHDR